MGKKISALKSAPACLIIFAKEPELGRVKTRLGTLLSAQDCLGLYKAFLKDTSALVGRVDCPLKILAYDVWQKQPRYLKKIFPQCIFYRQKGKNLGERMHQAFQYAQKFGARGTVIIGSDAPTLPAEYIKQAFKRLSKKDVVLGPSYDGGYYLIGVNAPCQNLFKDVAWSCDQVLKTTLQNAESLGKRVCLLKKWWDIDDAEGLKSLHKKFQYADGQGFWTKRFLG